MQINGPIREEKWNYPRIAIREGIMNALVHKDYSRPSAITNIRIFPSSLEIQNTGTLPMSISFAQIENNNVKKVEFEFNGKKVSNYLMLKKELYKLKWLDIISNKR